MDASSLHFPKSYLLQRTGRCPSAAVMITPMQSRCPLVSGSQLLHHLSLYCEVSEKVKIFHYLVSVFSGLYSGSHASREAQNCVSRQFRFN